MLTNKQKKYLRFLLVVMSIILIGLLSDAIRTIFRPLVSPDNYWSWFIFIMFYEIWMLASNIHIMKSENQNSWQRTETPKFRIVLNLVAVLFAVYVLFKAGVFLYMVIFFSQASISLLVAIFDLRENKKF